MNALEKWIQAQKQNETEHQRRVKTIHRKFWLMMLLLGAVVVVALIV